MLSAVGETRLMPGPEIDCLVINAKTGYSRSNHSWILSRMMRDFEWWFPRLVKPAERHKLESLREQSKDPQNVRVGLCISVWQCTKASGRGSGDFVYWIGLLVAVLQIAIAAIPWGLYGEWFTFMVTTAGTVLAFASSALPQWAEEKVGVRHWTERKDIILTEGNGAHDAILLLGCQDGLDLEALAGPYRLLKSPWTTRILSVTLATLWVALLLSVAGWQQHTWYILGVGILGLLHNVFVAGKKRQPEAFGIHLAYEETILETKVMKTLWELEGRYPRAGKAILSVFFPGSLRKREERLWEFAEKRYQALKNLADDRSPAKEHWSRLPPLFSPNGHAYLDDIPEEGPYEGPADNQCANAKSPHYVLDMPSDVAGTPDASSPARRPSSEQAVPGATSHI